MAETVPARSQIAVLLMLAGGSLGAGLQLAFGALPLPASLGLPQKPPAISGYTVTATETTTPLALHPQSRGPWQRWQLREPGTDAPLQLSIIPINVRNRLDLSIAAITSNDPALKSLALKQRRPLTIAGEPTLHLAIGQLNGANHPHTAVQTCVVMPSRAQRSGATGITYKQLVKPIVALNSGRDQNEWQRKLVDFAGLGPQSRWSCLLVSLSRAGQSTAVDQQLIHTLQPLILDLTSRAH